MTYLRRRLFMVGLAGATSLPSLGPTMVRAASGTLESSPSLDQSAAFTRAAVKAVADGQPLFLAAGRYRLANVELPDGLHLVGVPGATILTTDGEARLARITNAGAVRVDGITFRAEQPEMAAGVNGLVEIWTSTGISFNNCRFENAAGNGISASDSAVTVTNCDFVGASAAAIHSQNGRGLIVSGCRIDGADNAGLRIWRDTAGHDGSIVTGNIISRINWRDGGNGQNGNGVSIYKADSVIVADNIISDCAFTAIRVNEGRNTQIRGNTCRNSGEVAIFSEFGFSGSAISSNIIDGAATGISITNLDSGGHLATCTGNIVRNITPKSAVNPDTRPVGIFAEADAVISANTVENVPGIGIAAGYGPFVRNVVISANVVTGATYGIGVSVVQEQSPGPVRIDGNIVSGAQSALIGLKWEEIVTTDLARDAATWPNIQIGDNATG